MQRQTYTQEDLKQVLQRVIIEKRPVPLIKKEIPPEKEIPPVMIQETIIQEAVVKESLLPIMPMARAANEVSNPTQIHKESSDKDSQIALLKTIIKELAGKEKTKK